jgi:septal ring factor EnvC (AmiA/AmiB activator)
MAIDYSRNTLVNNASLVAAINDELEKIDVALADAVSRSGYAPNALAATLDAGGNDVINVGTMSVDDFLVDGAQVPSLQDLAEDYAAYLATFQQIQSDTEAAQAAAEDARDAAQLAETNAETAEAGAVTAQGLAEDARDAAQLAETNAETAQSAAEVAQAAAEAAQSAAEIAETNAETAQAGAEAAEASAQSVVDNFYLPLEVTASRTLTASDNKRVLYVTAAATLTLPEDATEALPVGFAVDIQKSVAGTVDVATEGTDVLQSAGSSEIITQYAWASVIKLESGIWAIVGDV